MVFFVTESLNDIRLNNTKEFQLISEKSVAMLNVCHIKLDFPRTALRQIL